MKRNLLITALIAIVAALSCCTPPRPRTIENPMVEANNTGSLSVTAVDVTDSATVLHMHYAGNPGYWMRIAGTSRIEADGKAYQLIGGEGIVPDSLLWMPESGEVEFSLIFPAVPARVKSVDFIEADGEDQWHIWGIDLTGKIKEPAWLKEVPSKLRNIDFSGSLPEAVLDTATTRINVQVLGFRKDMPTRIDLNLWPIGAPSKEVAVALDSLGRGSVEVWLAGNAHATMRYGSGGGFVWLAPGETVDVYVAPPMQKSVAELLGRRLYCTGRYSALPAILERVMANPDLDYLPKFEVAYDCSSEEYTDRLVDYYNDQVQYVDQAGFEPMMAEFVLAKVRADVMDKASYPADRLRLFFHKQEGWNRIFSPDMLSFYELDREQLDRIGMLFDTGDQALLLVNDGDFGRNDWLGGVTHYPEVFGMLREKLRLAEEGKLTEADLDELHKLDSPFYAEAAAGVQKQAEEILQSAANSKLLPTPDVDADKVFDAIIAPHKGKVVMVDLWNTWCGPCRAALAANEPLKSGELSSDDIVWIYIANETSPLPKYIDMIGDIQGLHYRLNPEQWRAVCDRFGVDGIPYYILVQRDGTAAGRPDLRDHDLYKSEIIKALNGR